MKLLPDMELKQTSACLNASDIALRDGDEILWDKFFYKEIGGVISRIRMKVFAGRVSLDEMTGEFYRYLSEDCGNKLRGVEDMSGCPMSAWLIAAAWRFFIGKREHFEKTEVSSEKAEAMFRSADDLRIQIAIEVNAVLARMADARYAEVIRLLIIEGFAPEDVAEMLGMEAENVDDFKRRAIAQFIELYGK